MRMKFSAIILVLALFVVMLSDITTAETKSRRTEPARRVERSARGRRRAVGQFKAGKEREVGVKAAEDEMELEVFINRRGAFSCGAKGETCFVSCCDHLHCFWPQGFSITKAGVCVDCVVRQETCQQDSQCCQPSVCHKPSRNRLDGRCDVKRAKGGQCYSGTQCLSGKCSASFGDKLVGSGGACA